MAARLPLNDSTISTIYGRSKGKFFRDETLRFFDSYVLGNARMLSNNRALFITSEKNGWDATRRYTIRFQDCDGRIETLGAFQQYATADQATRAMRSESVPEGD